MISYASVVVKIMNSTLNSVVRFHWNNSRRLCFGSGAFARFECLFCLRHRHRHRLRWLITQSSRNFMSINYGPWTPLLDPIKTAATTRLWQWWKNKPASDTYYVENSKQSSRCREFFALRTVFSFPLWFRSAKVCRTLSVKFTIKWNFNWMFAPCQSIINGIRNHRVCLSDWLADWLTHISINHLEQFTFIYFCFESQFAQFPKIITFVLLSFGVALTQQTQRH